MANYWDNDIQLPENANSNNNIHNQNTFGVSYDADRAASESAQNYANPYPAKAEKPVYGASPYASAPNNPPEKPKKEKKHGFGAGIIAICVVLSLACGFLGSYAANRFFPAEVPTQQEESGFIEAPEHTGSTSVGTGSLSDTISTIKDSVVEITTESATTSNYFGQYVTQGAGSGVIFREDGYIITNNHVISDANTITVRLTNGEEYTAQLVGTDSRTDIAVIKIEATGLTPAVLGSSDSVKVGDEVLAIGNPLGSLGGTVTNGIISALDREILVQGQTMTLLQTNAAVNPGNSGGGLFNTYGELIGIVNAKSSSSTGSGSSIEGLGFAIPVDTVKEVASELISNGYVTGRPALGISVISINDAQMAQQYGVNRYGVYIVSVTEGSGADKAGLKAGDLIMAIGDTVVEETSDVTSTLQDYAVGDTVELQIVRDGKIVSASVVLGESTPA